MIPIELLLQFNYKFNLNNISYYCMFFEPGVTKTSKILFYYLDGKWRVHDKG